MATFVVFLPGFSEFDTSKYLTISEDMMRQHNYLLAYWQGHIYSDKPPLLFWLFIGGWKVFGFSYWWPQFVVMAIATLSIFASQKLGKSLWPNQPTIANLIPIILVGCFYWVWFAKQIRVDSILVLATLLSIYCIVKSIQGKKIYWLGYVLAIGLGGFAKGPVILAFVLLPAIFLPVMIDNENGFSPKWYAFLGLATIIGLAIPLTWAIPAAIQGGSAFTQEIFYRQITHRQSMHQSSLFFYVSRLPLWLLPWSIYPPAYKGLRSLKLFKPVSCDTACLAIILCGIVAFSVFGQKLPHYLYPLFPFFAILIARLCAHPTIYKQRHQWPMAILIFALALFCLSFPFISASLPEKAFIRGYFLQEINLNLWGGALLVTALVLLFANLRTKFLQIILISCSSVLIALFVNNAVLYSYQKHINKKQLIKALNTIEQPVIASGDFKDQQITNYIQQHHIQVLPQDQLQHWQATHKDYAVLTTQMNLIHQKQKPIAWYYQTRFSVVSLWD